MRGFVYRLAVKRQDRARTASFLQMPYIFKVLLIGLAGVILAHAPFFRIHHFEILNQGTVTEEEIMVASGIVRGQSIFWLDRRMLGEAILKNPKIKAVEIIRKYPDRVQLVIDERLPIAVMPYQDQVVWIGEDGVMMAVTDRQFQPQVPMVTGYRLTGVNLGTAVKDPNFETVSMIVTHFNDQLHQIVKRIDLSRLCLYIQGQDGEEIPVEFGDGRQIERKIANLKAILRRIDFRRTAAIDLRVAGIPTVISKN